MRGVLHLACLILAVDAGRVSVNRRLSKTDRHAVAVDATQAASLSPKVMHMIEEMMVNECAFKLINNYVKIIGTEAFASAKAAAVEKMQREYEDEWPLVKNATVIKMQVIDVMKYPECTVGAPLLPCFGTLGPMDLLEQRWLLEKFHEGDGHHGLGAWLWSEHKEYPVPEKQFLAMHQLFRQSLKAMNFSGSRAKVYCWSAAGKPLPGSVRACLMEKAEGNKTRQDMLVKKFELEDKRETYRAMASRWYDMFGRSQRWRAKKEHQDFEDQIKSLKVQLYGKEHGGDDDVEECENDADPSKMVATKARVEHELTDSCNEHTDCHEKYGRMSPPGYACDYQKDFTPERAVVGVVIGDVVSMGIYPAIGFTVGFATGGASAASQMALQWALIPNFPWDIILSTMGASALSRSIFPSCMAFPLTCDRNPKSSLCEMRATSSTARASSNPLARLPMDGFKCAQTNASGHVACQLQICSGEDVKVKGPGQLFGRTGIADGGTYNCANTKGTARSFLGNLEKVPNPSFTGEVANTVEARHALQMLFSSVGGGLGALKSSSEEPQPSCTEEDLKEIKQQYRIVNTMDDGRFYVTCPDDVVTAKNQYQASCKREHCDGYPWCLTDCSTFGHCSPLPPVKCE